uniref:Uncharacterized protein n=1 Tax=Acrobeloides nanus TaxID=290746 RepID=A0A914EHX3_9BILA
MTTIEKPANEPPNRFIEHPEIDDPAERRQNSMKELSALNDAPNNSQEHMNDVMMPIRPVSHFGQRSRIQGSRTWSTHDYSLKDEVNSRPQPIVPIVMHTAEKRAPFSMEDGGIAKKLATPHAHALPPKTIYTSKYTKLSEKTVPVGPRPKRHRSEGETSRVKREQDYYDELQDSNQPQNNNPLLMNDAIDNPSRTDSSYASTSAPNPVYQRLNCIQYVVDL